VLLKRLCLFLVVVTERQERATKKDMDAAGLFNKQTSALQTDILFFFSLKNINMFGYFILSFNVFFPLLQKFKF